MILLLPSEVVLEICHYLNTADILSLRQVWNHPHLLFKMLNVLRDWRSFGLDYPGQTDLG